LFELPEVALALELSAFIINDASKIKTIELIFKKNLFILITSILGNCSEVDVRPLWVGDQVHGLVGFTAVIYCICFLPLAVFAKFSNFFFFHILSFAFLIIFVVLFISFI